MLESGMARSGLQLEQVSRTGCDQISGLCISSSSRSAISRFAENVAKLSDHAKRTYYAIQKLPDSDAFLKNLLCEDEIAHANHSMRFVAAKMRFAFVGYFVDFAGF